MQETENHVFKSVSVDWLSVTAKEQTQCGDLAESAGNLIHELKSQGYILKNWGMSGFDGYSCGGVQLGRRHSEVIVRLSGAQAAMNWRKFYALANNVTRIDVECSTDSGINCERRITRHLQQARRFSRNAKRQKSLRLVRDYTGGSTIYLGKRTSGRFGRIYNKEVESEMEHFRNCVRYEVEYKGELASLVAHRLLGQSRECAAICGEVLSFMSMYGVSLPWSMDRSERILLPRRRSDYYKRLGWLREAVGPSCRLLVGSGFGPQVLDALGLRIQGNTLTISDSHKRLRAVS